MGRSLLHEPHIRAIIANYRDLTERKGRRRRSAPIKEGRLALHMEAMGELARLPGEALKATTDRITGEIASGGCDKAENVYVEVWVCDGADGWFIPRLAVYVLALSN